MEPATTALHSSSPSTDTMSELQYLKMEDVHHSTSTSPAPSAATDGPAWSTSSPAPIVVQSKPTKKRKSWGQALPEPKTALPPRKRAKTDDEKEQRRIERIKRNRAAAHNSRERKRQETEDLAVKLAKANAELAAFKAHFGELPSHIVLPEVKVEVDDSGVITASAATPAPSLTESHGSQNDPASPTPTADDHPFHHIKMEPHDIPVELNVPQYDDSKLSALTPLDLTQHSAVSVEPHDQQYGFGTLVDASSFFSDGFQPAELLQDTPDSFMDNFAFADGAHDASISGSLFSIDEFLNVHEDSHLAVDAQTSGAV